MAEEMGMLGLMPADTLMLAGGHPHWAGIQCLAASSEEGCSNQKAWLQTLYTCRTSTREGRLRQEADQFEQAWITD